MTADQIVVPLPAAQFKHASALAPMPLGPEVTFAIRKDALFATDLLIQGLSRLPEVKNGNIDIAESVSDAYRDWGHSVLQSFSRYLDYDQYGVRENNSRSLTVMFYDATELAAHTIQNAYELAESHLKQPNARPMLVSLDDMIHQADGTRFPEIAFSRLFSLEGDEMDYVARPGHRPVEDQIKRIAQLAEHMAGKYGQPVPIVLLEDNVRRAKMLNWVIGKMDEAGVFKHAILAGISTSFCNAKEEERSKILHNGNPVPVKAVKDCDTNCIIDVATTRDLLFDGFVTQHGGLIGRLPGIFMDVEKRFKIAPKHAQAFRHEIIDANIKFCRDIEKSFGVNPPLSWFDGGPIISKISGIPPYTPMTQVMHSAKVGIFRKSAANDDPTYQSVNEDGTFDKALATLRTEEAGPQKTGMLCKPSMV